ncbi:hypothetical protein SRHO_G00167280 [Serrasalmus rhombeus]
MAKVLHAVAILLIVSRASPESTTVTVGSESDATLTTTPRSDASSLPQSTTVSSTTLTARPSFTERQESTRLSLEATSHTSATNSPSTATAKHATTDTHQSNSAETSTPSRATGQQSASVTSSQQGNSTISEQTTTTVQNDSITQPTATASTKKVNATQTTASQGVEGKSLPMSPGVVAVLCIFFIVLALVLVVVIAKVITSYRKPKFERLDDLPMSKMSEDSPFARYPPK